MEDEYELYLCEKMYHISQQACNALLSSELKAGRWRFIYMYLPAIYHSYKNETTMKTIRYTLALCLALLCLCGCKDIPHDGEAIIGHGATTYYGGTKQGKYDGYGVLYVGDSVVYAGQ